MPGCLLQPAGSYFYLARLLGEIVVVMVMVVVMVVLHNHYDLRLRRIR
jgi:hypothetical protein